MKTKDLVEWRGVKTEIPHGITYDKWMSLLEVLYGMTPVDSDDLKCAKWAARKALDVYDTLHAEGMAQ